MVETTKTPEALLSFYSLPLGLLISEICLEAIGQERRWDPVYRGTEQRGRQRIDLVIQKHP